jgi:hypothetical protein
LVGKKINTNNLKKRAEKQMNEEINIKANKRRGKN